MFPRVSPLLLRGSPHRDARLPPGGARLRRHASPIHCRSRTHPCADLKSLRGLPGASRRRTPGRRARDGCGTEARACARCSPPRRAACPRRSRSARACTAGGGSTGRTAPSRPRARACVAATASRSAPSRQTHDVDEPAPHVVVVVGERRLDVDARAATSAYRVGDLGARREDLVEPLDLADAERGGDVVEAVVVAEPAVQEPRARLEPPLVPQRDEQLVLALVVRRHRAALARRHLLVRVERERRRMAVRAERPALVSRAERLARVLHELQGRAARTARAADRARTGSRRCRRRRSPSSAR